MLPKSILITIIALALLGVLDTGYSIYQHYNTEGDAACNISATVNCDAVNQSVYSEMSGIPVAAIGMAGYIFFVGICGLMLAGRDLGGWSLPLLLTAALFALVYSAALTYIEFFVLEAVCPMCVISMTLITIITLLAYGGAIRSRPARKDLNTAGA